MSQRVQARSESQFVELLQQQDRMAFEQLYDEYSAAIYGLVFQILKDEMLAEDALQETFVRIWRKISSYDPSKGRFFTWVLNIARNLAIDILRANQVRHSKDMLSIEQPLVIAKGPSESIAIEHIGIRALVDGLSPEQRLLVDLIYYQGFTQQEAAEALDIPLGTVKSRIRLAMNHLRNAMT